MCVDADRLRPKAADDLTVSHLLGDELHLAALNDSETIMPQETTSIALAVELTAAWLANPNTRTTADEAPEFLRFMHRTVLQLTGTPVQLVQDDPEQAFEPVVTVRKSLASPDQILSLINGKPYKTLRRHLATHGLTPAEYRARYNLGADYPMVAPSYSDARRTMAKSIGLGRNFKTTTGKVIDVANKLPRKPRAPKAPRDA